jgi:hypothetical protein
MYPMRTIRLLAFAAAICTLAACGSSTTLPTAATPASAHRDGTTTTDCKDIGGTVGSGNAAGCPTSGSGDEIGGMMGSGN